MSFTTWAIPALSKLLPLDEQSLQDIVEYTCTLTRSAAAEHLTGILGTSPQALEFIGTFQSRRPAPPVDNAPASSNLLQSTPIPNNAAPESGPPKVTRQKKKKPPLHSAGPTRRIEGTTEGGYVKKAEEDYMQARRRPDKEPELANRLVLQPKADKKLSAREILSSPSPKLPPSAAGPLISDTLGPRPNAARPTNSSSAKISLTGGTSMRGDSTTLADLDSAIRSLEKSTNPSLRTQADDAARRCNCMAQRHALLAAAPNCLNCGKIICAKEGLGPCTFCNTPLLSSTEVQAMLHSLREERGLEMQQVINASHRRAEVAKAPRPFSGTTSASSGISTPASASESEISLASAKAHRDRLLAFQAQNARRTRVHDEAADFETPDSGTSQWATPQDRALQLKRQQHVLREQEWNARPEYEKRQVVVSLEVDGKGRGRAVKKMMEISRPEVHVDDEMEAEPPVSSGTGNFASNPLLGALIKPVARQAKGKQRHDDKPASGWRRVQDDLGPENNEELLLDGGLDVN